jgi:hypothetical protein
MPLETIEVDQSWTDPVPRPRLDDLDRDPLSRPPRRSAVVLKPDQQAVEDAMEALIRAARVLPDRVPVLSERDARQVRLLAARLLQAVGETPGAA